MFLDAPKRGAPALHRAGTMLLGILFQGSLRATILLIRTMQ